MKEEFQKQLEMCNKSWKSGLASGKELRGNFELNLEFLNSINILKPGLRVLEIGCGIGAMTNAIHGFGCESIGVDISDCAINYGRKQFTKIDLRSCPAEELPFEDESFDVVVSFDLFEHIAKVDRHLSEVRRVLKKDGFYLLQTPNKLSNITFETLRNKSLGWKKYHPSLHSCGELKRRFRKHGFSSSFIKMNPVNEFTLSKLNNKLARSIFGKLNFKKLPFCLQTNLYVITQKKDN